MGCYVYCIVPIGHTPGNIHGIDRQPVSQLEGAGLGCWVSLLDKRPEPSLDRVREHNAVIQAAVTDTVTPVPIRFGQWLESTPALLELLAQNAGRYTTLLAQFAGALEFGLRVLDPDRPSRVSTTAEAASGTAYLTALRDQLRGAELDQPEIAALRAVLHEAFEDTVKSEQFEPLRTSHGLLSVTHLVDRSRFDAYRATVVRVRAQQPQLRFLATGPWPPYSFAA